MTLRHVRYRRQFSHILAARGGELLGRELMRPQESLDLLAPIIITLSERWTRCLVLSLYTHTLTMRERETAARLTFHIRYTLNNAGNLFYLRRHFSIFISHTHQRHYLNYITRVNIICSASEWASARAGPHRIVNKLNVFIKRCLNKFGIITLSPKHLREGHQKLTQLSS
jgi:hypothetical protein